MLRWIIPVFLIVAGLLAWAAPPASGTPKGAPSPEEAVKAFAEALSAQDLVRAAALVHEAPEPKDFDDLVRQLKSAERTFRVTVVRATKNGDRASARYGLVVTLGSKISQRENLNVVSELASVDGRWFLVGPALGTAKDPMNEWAAMLKAGPEGVRRARLAADQALAMSRIKQLAAATLLYAAENDGRFLFNQKNWKDKIADKVEDPETWKSPGDKSEGPSFTFNQNLANRDLTSIRIKQRTVLLFEGKGAKPTYRWEGKAAVAYVDGSVMMISESDARRILWR